MTTTAAKVANLIVIGGHISAGKTTLASNLRIPKYFEIDESNKLQSLLLEYFYRHHRLANEIIELYFLEMRVKTYYEAAAKGELAALDRSIFESLWFASKSLSPRNFMHFNKLWEQMVHKIIRECGRPLIYVFLSIDWETFKERIFIRNRSEEVENFKRNETYFREHISQYQEYMCEIFERFKINYIVARTDKNSIYETNRMIADRLTEAGVYLDQ